MPVVIIVLAVLTFVGPILSGYSLVKDVPRLHHHQTPQNFLRVGTDTVGLIPGLGAIGMASGAINFLASHGKPESPHFEVYRGGGHGMGHGK